MKLGVQVHYTKDFEILIENKKKHKEEQKSEKNSDAKIQFSLRC